MALIIPDSMTLACALLNGLASTGGKIRRQDIRSRKCAKDLARLNGAIMLLTGLESESSDILEKVEYGRGTKGRVGINRSRRYNRAHAHLHVARGMHGDGINSDRK